MSESIPAAKDALRRRALEHRDAMSVVQRNAASMRIAERLVSLLDERNSRCVALYSPIRSEVDVQPIVAALVDSGAGMALPSVAADDLVFRSWMPGDPLIEGAFGVGQPSAEAPLVTPDAIVLPVAAFDRNCGRLGYGRGFYDWAIAGLRNAGADPWLVGAAFSVQEVEFIPAEDHDVALDMIVTENERIAVAG